MKRILFALLGLPISALAEGGLPNQPYIYVEGKAEIRTPADLVNLQFDVVARNADETKANQEVQAKAARIFAMLNERKIAENDVVAENLTSEPQYQDEENSLRGHGKLVGYKVTRPFMVKVRDLAAFPKLIDDLLALGGLEFSRVDPELSNEKELKGQASDTALTDARERAEKTLKALAMKIDSVFAVSPVAFPEIIQGIFGSVEMVGGARGAQSVSKQLNPSQYRLAPVTISQSVHVIYLISPTK
jgi:uncharacterized protein YggE